MLPRSGWSKPAISRRQVVFPEPLGPSRAKNSPGAMVSETRSSATTLPKARLVSRSSMAGVMVSGERRRRAGGAARSGFVAGSASAHHRDVVRSPAAVGHTGALAAGGFRRAPEVDLVEVVEAVRGAARVAEQGIARA